MTATQAPTPGPLSVGDRVVAVADLRKHPDGPVWVQKGEEVGIVREYGIDNCIAGVALQDGREGDWAKSCFRLAPTAPVEASGSERRYDSIREAEDRELFSPASSSQPSGETRFGDETAEKIVKRWAAWINDVSEDMEEPEWGGKTRNDVLNERDFLIRCLSARPLALGGQQGEGLYRVGEFIGNRPVLCQHGNIDPNNLCAYCEGEEAYPGRSDTTPARAEAQDEGAAGEPVAWQRRFYDIDGKPSAWEQTDPPPPQANAMSRIVEYRALYAHPSPTPAADADRVRIACEKAAIAGALGNVLPLDIDWQHIRVASQAVVEALAALKSTAAKEGGERSEPDA